MIRNDNPDKGTETNTKQIKNSYCRIRNDNPDKGTETKAIAANSVEIIRKIRNDNPDKGTETKI